MPSPATCPPTGLVPHPVIDPSRAQTMLTGLTQMPRFVSGNWVEATAAGLYPAILEGALVTQSSRKIPPRNTSDFEPSLADIPPLPAARDYISNPTPIPPFTTV